MYKINKYLEYAIQVINDHQNHFFWDSPLVMSGGLDLDLYIYIEF